MKIYQSIQQSDKSSLKSLNEDIREHLATINTNNQTSSLESVKKYLNIASNEKYMSALIPTSFDVDSIPVPNTSATITHRLLDADRTNNKASLNLNNINNGYTKKNKRIKNILSKTRD